MRQRTTRVLSARTPALLPGETRLLKTTLVILLAAALLAATAPGDTIATFSDPALDGTTPLFTLSGGTLSGGWVNPGSPDLPLDLIMPNTGVTYPDASFSMTDLTVLDPFGTLSGGVLEFHDSSDELVLRIDFDSAYLSVPLGFGASHLVGHGVTFSGPSIPGPLEQEAFAFGFANPVQTQHGLSWTASFTSSAVVPEPSSLALLLAPGIVRTLFRRRRPGLTVR